MSDTLRDRIERYYATVPLSFAVAEDFGTLRLFVREGPGTPYYGGPSHAQPTGRGTVDTIDVDAATVDVGDIARVRARQRELGVPEAFEWLAETAPGMRGLMEAAGLPVLERPLMVLEPHRALSATPLPGGATLRVVTADDPVLPAVLALPRLAFAQQDTEVGPAGRAELLRVAGEVRADGTVDAVRPTLAAGHKTLIAALGPDGTPLAAGHYHPAAGATEIGGVGTLPSARRQGLAPAVTAALARHARDHGVGTVFLAYAQDVVARIYTRLGFRRTDTTLLIANQPARS
ncbi:GNAT family N-acetyltransferase [Streptomyces sp. NPDC048664]|uniref:GNAT family N-acetyltransferase n=1 Tax=Streptomyces sp. NPDC048664 TaxID=3154505 RepID=UPI0034379F64